MKMNLQKILRSTLPKGLNHREEEEEEKKVMLRKKVKIRKRRKDLNLDLNLEKDKLILMEELLKKIIEKGLKKEKEAEESQG